MFEFVKNLFRNRETAEEAAKRENSRKTGWYIRFQMASTVTRGYCTTSEEMKLTADVQIPRGAVAILRYRYNIEGHPIDFTTFYFGVESFRLSDPETKKFLSHKEIEQCKRMNIEQILIDKYGNWVLVRSRNYVLKMDVKDIFDVLKMVDRNKKRKENRGS